MERLSITIPITTPTAKIKECIGKFYEENVHVKIHKDMKTLDSKLIIHIPEELQSKHEIFRLGMIAGIYIK